MDQLKQQLAVVSKYGFWISTALVALVAVGVWFMATGTLIEESEKQISALKTASSSIDTIRSEVNKHPNDLSHALMEAMVAKEEAAVAAAWQSQYDRQQNILVWPSDSLDSDFIKRVKPFFPIETHFSEFPVPPEQEIETRYLEAYRDYIGDVLQSKADIVGAEWKADFASVSASGMGMGMEGGMDSGMGMGMEAGMGIDGGAMRGGPGMATVGAMKEKGPLVQWKSSSQEEILRDLFPWRGNRPTTLEVLYSQENLWVMTQLLQIVADVNGNITQPFQAKIHEIEKIGIGRSAKRAEGSISPVTAGGGSGNGEMMMSGGGMMEGMDMETSGSAMPGGMDMEGGMGGSAEAIDPLESRYVDSNYEPIEASRVRQAMSADNRNPEDAFLTVAKRLPVVLRVKMDQREIPRLLAVCGNAALMVEVRQIRVNPSGSSGGGGSMDVGMGSMGSMGGMEDSGLGSGSMMEGMGTSGGMDDMMGSMGGGMGGRTGAGGSYPMDMPVEIYGIIHIYNPPAMQKLGVDQVDSSTVVEGQAMGDQPPADPATATEPAATTEPAVAEPADPGAPAAAPEPAEPAAPEPAATEPAAPEPAAPEPAGPEPAGPAAAPEPAAAAAAPAATEPPTP